MYKVTLLSFLDLYASIKPKDRPSRNVDFIESIFNLTDPTFSDPVSYTHLRAHETLR